MEKYTLDKRLETRDQRNETRDKRRETARNSQLATRNLSLVSCLTYAQNTVGIIQNTNLSFNGYTLFSPGSSMMTYLIDNCGNLVNTWESEYRPGEVAYLLENGNLLRACRLASGTFFGGGIGGRIEMHNWEGELLWAYNHISEEYHQHHDLEYLPNGNILLIAWEYRSEEEAIEMGRDPSTVYQAIWPTQVVEIQPIGTEEAAIVWEWHLWDHLIQDHDSTKANYGVVADHPELLDINFTRGGGQGGNSDWIHANSVDYNPELDQILINSWHLSEFWVIDHSTSTEEAAGHTGGNAGKGGDILYRWGNPQVYQRGTAADQRLYRQHDAHWITQGLPDAGKVMIFNNGLGRPGGNYSSIDVIELPIEADGNYTLLPGETYGPSQLFWTYEADTPQSFFSSFMSGAQRQPNGNTLICEGARGRLFEVDTAGNTVWTYISPVTFSGPVSQGNTPNGQNSVFRTYRYAPDYEAFTGRDLTPGEPIELNPSDSNCQILVSTDDIMVSSPVNVFPNPVTSYLNIVNDDATEIRVEVFDVAGRALEMQTGSSTLSLNLNHYQKGIYFIKIYTKNNDLLSTKKIIKM